MLMIGENIKSLEKRSRKKGSKIFISSDNNNELFTYNINNNQ